MVNATRKALCTASKQFHQCGSGGGSYGGAASIMLPCLFTAV